MKIKFIFVLLALALVGCGEPTLDGTTEEAMKASVEKVAAKLDDAKKLKFKESLQVVAFSKLDVNSMMAGKQTPADASASMFKELNGKTADQVIAQADQIRAEREAREKTQALSEIQELNAKKDVVEKAKVELAKFTVNRSRFYLEEQKYSVYKKPFIEVAVTNGTVHPVSRVYFNGTIASPNRSIPWFANTFNYSIPGGLEPGENGTWTLAPNQFSDWGKVEAPVDAVFTVEVVRIDGPDGNALYSSQGLSEREQKRLSELEQKYKK